MINRLKELIIDNKYPIGSYGIEREMLRVDRNGILSFKPHPKGLGDKLKNPYITTDFSESQIEVITPAFNDSRSTYEFVNDLYDITASEIEDEYLWPQSMPCEIPEGKEIPIAEFGMDECAVDAKEYREKLLNKYGAKKQLISGIHYNFSFTEELMKGLYADECNELTYTEFKNKVYLKVARNYLRYRWIIIYLFGSTSTLHKSFIEDEDCIKCYKQVIEDTFVHEEGISYRNGECGYRNLVDLFPNYDSVGEYVDSIKEYIKEGLIESHKELYSQIRLKPKDPKNFLNSLQQEGIKYLEYRTIDVNPFEKGGISLVDLDFLEVYNLFLLLKEESDYETWQEEALENQNSVAKFGKNSVSLIRDGKNVSKTQWGLELLNEMMNICKELQLKKEDSIQIMIDRFQDSKLTYAYKIEEKVKELGYINTYMNLAKQYKNEASKEIKNKELYNYMKKWVNNNL